ncbi:MAG: glycosyltransferase [Muribaculaceae bacterium]|nr:glycosyltransferase [Muribaculaceae bacterium]
MIQLQVLISAYGAKGIQSVASLPHPEVEGVSYLVSWQYADDSPEIPRSLLDRKDFTVIPTSTRGLSINRNLALEASSAPLLLLGDDDIIYSREYLLAVIEAFRSHPDVDFICFRYKSERHPVDHPVSELRLTKPPWWLISFCMAFRRDVIEKSGVRFDERFGIGAEFPSAEESVFLNDLLRKGIKALYLPVTVAEHPGATTVMRTETMPDFISAKAAAFVKIYPLTWPMRMITHALRFSDSMKERQRYISIWLDAVRRFRQKPHGRKKS